MAIIPLLAGVVTLIIILATLHHTCEVSAVDGIRISPLTRYLTAGNRTRNRRIAWCTGNTVSANTSAAADYVPKRDWRAGGGEWKSREKDIGHTQLFGAIPCFEDLVRNLVGMHGLLPHDTSVIRSNANAYQAEHDALVLPDDRPNAGRPSF